MIFKIKSIELGDYNYREILLFMPLSQVRIYFKATSIKGTHISNILLCRMFIRSLLLVMMMMEEVVLNDMANEEYI